MTGKNDPTSPASTAYTPDRTKRSRKVDPEARFYKIVSLGAIITGILACLASVGVGMGLVLTGTMILAEL